MPTPAARPARPPSQASCSAPRASARRGRGPFIRRRASSPSEYGHRRRQEEPDPRRAPAGRRARLAHRAPASGRHSLRRHTPLRHLARARARARAPAVALAVDHVAGERPPPRPARRARLRPRLDAQRLLATLHLLPARRRLPAVRVAAARGRRAPGPVVRSLPPRSGRAARRRRPHHVPPRGRSEEQRSEERRDREDPPVRHAGNDTPPPLRAPSPVPEPTHPRALLAGRLAPPDRIRRRRRRSRSSPARAARHTSAHDLR